MSSDDATRAHGAAPQSRTPGGRPASGTVEAEGGRERTDDPARQGGAERTRATETSGAARGGQPEAPTTAVPTTAVPTAGDPGDPPTAALPTPGDSRGARPAPAGSRADGRTAAPTRPAPRPRRARLAVQRVDPWSVFVFSLLASICVGIVLLVAVAALYLALSSLGVLESVSDLIREVTGDDEEVGTSLFSAGRVLGVTAVVAAIDVVLLTALSTLGAVLYNVCAALTGGIEVVLRERD